mgnify:CR=1 FL=1
MPKLIVQNLFDKEVYVAPGQKVLAALQEAGIDWMHACGGKGRCTTCKVVIIDLVNSWRFCTIDRLEPKAEACDLRYQSVPRRRELNCINVATDVTDRQVEWRGLGHRLLL